MGNFGGSESFGNNKNSSLNQDSAPNFGKTIEITRATNLSYGVGDRVKHHMFGEGKVLEIVDSAKDYMVTVQFDRVGVKKMTASFAKLQKV